MTVAQQNPLNLAYRPQDKWAGLASPPNNGRWCVFTAPEYAFRAYTKELISYIRVGHDTVPKFIRTWSTTDQDAYIVNVLRWGHFGAQQVLTVDDALALFKAMCRQEDGSDPYPDEIISKGIAMALNTTPTTMTSVMTHPTTMKAITGGSAAAFIGMELAKFHIYDMSAGETVALGIVISILFHRLFPNGLSAE